MSTEAAVDQCTVSDDFCVSGRITFANAESVRADGIAWTKLLRPELMQSPLAWLSWVTRPV